MFADRQSETSSGAEAWFDAWARRHPRAFTGLLVLIAAAVTVGLLFKTEYAYVMYQGF